MDLLMERSGRRVALVVLLVTALLALPAAGGVRLKDIARIDVGGELQLVGYGLVVGLDGTGDTKSSLFTMQSMTNMLSRLGITIPQSKMKSKNTAAVMVVAQLTRFHRKGSNLDVTVSSIGDASSLEGGTLLITPLATPEGAVYATAQGPVSVGGFTAGGGGGDQITQNYVLVGRIPGGGIVEREWAARKKRTTIALLLHDPDYTTAKRIQSAINRELGEGTALARDAGTIQVSPLDSDSTVDRVSLLARLESIEVEPDAAARIVVNERTGTIVAGENVTISSVAIAHGNLSVQIRTEQSVSQPAPLSTGETVQYQNSDVSVSTENTGLVPIGESASVGDLARALNALGVTPRDMIAIFQALRQAGALRAELRII